ncbi:MAG: hypothetical protein FJZ96_11925, partial [Chloroflexi bacterium]|nr:hypothetical protein [Chloroflexota bacterium]
MIVPAPQFPEPEDPLEYKKGKSKQAVSPARRLNEILSGGQPAESRPAVPQPAVPQPAESHPAGAQPAVGIPSSSEPVKPRQRRSRPKRMQFPSLQVRREKLPPAYWTVTGTISLIVNILLIAVLALLGRERFFLKQLLVGDVLGGMYVNFGRLDQAHIRREILVQDTIQVSFPLTINQVTEVVLVADTPVTGATVSLVTGGLEIVRAPSNIILPAGTRLPVQLSLVVDVNQAVPVSLTVLVDIPLSETELHEPFTALQKTIEPFIRAFYED